MSAFKKRAFIMNTGFVALLLTGSIAFCGTMQKTPKQEQAKSKVVASSKKDSTAALKEKPKDEVVVVYYFHGNQRCPTCFKLEKYSNEAVQSAFADALKNGKIVWKVINVEEKGNEHYAEDYKLYTKSVIVSVVKNGEEINWKNLDKIWELVPDETKFKEYITKEVRACFEGKCS
jgi:hypothetical protein